MINNNVNNSVAAAEHTIGKRVVPKTIKNYMGKLNILKIYLATKSDDSLFDLDGNIALPLPTLLIHDIFGWLSTNTDLPKRNRSSTRRINQPNERQLGNENNELSDSDSEHEAVAEEGTNNAGAVDLFASSEVTVSASCMQGYKSALIWWYAEKKKMRLKQGQNDWIDNFIKGYKKIVADKKARRCNVHFRRKISTFVQWISLYLEVNNDDSKASESKIYLDGRNIFLEFYDSQLESYCTGELCRKHYASAH